MFMFDLLRNRLSKTNIWLWVRGGGGYNMCEFWVRNFTNTLKNVSLKVLNVFSSRILNYQNFDILVILTKTLFTIAIISNLCRYY